MYDPTVGRWLSEDPIGFEGDDANLYRYVGNRVTTYVDPDGQKSEWHHLLSQSREFTEYWRKAKIDIHAAEFGWIIDDEYHRRVPGGKLHPNWETDWQCFKRDNPVPNREKILAQLDSMKRKYSQILRNGKQATVSYGEWQQWQKYLREAAERAATQKTTVKVKLPARSVVDKFGKVVKVAPVVVFAWVAATESVFVAAEGCTEDALWPFLDIARSASDPFASLMHESVRGGQLSRRLQVKQFEEILGQPLEDRKTRD